MHSLSASSYICNLVINILQKKRDSVVVNLLIPYLIIIKCFANQSNRLTNWFSFQPLGLSLKDLF